MNACSVCGKPAVAFRRILGIVVHFCQEHLK